MDNIMQIHAKSQAYYGSLQQEFRQIFSCPLETVGRSPSLAFAPAKQCHHPSSESADSRCFERHTNHDWSKEKDVKGRLTGSNFGRVDSIRFGGREAKSLRPPNNK
jgi:hypothetical protein